MTTPIVMKLYQKEIRLQPYKRGFHLITREVLGAIAELATIESGLLHVFIKHTSASLTINENADASVREDFERHMNVLVPERATYYTHTFEGDDDMPAHIKTSLMGSSVQIPITHGRLNLGVWQGVYLCEHRDHAVGRELVITAYGT